ncbi:hypothetical protein H0A64_07290 [Alcaligenaceae bacterium]|nr:hypothetical protein [Alcaligenaceae bacterium]
MNAVRRRRFSTYGSDPTPAVPNLLNRNFHALILNTKWLTDLTEIPIPAGEVYVSPITDCFDGLVVASNIGTNPDAALVSTILDQGVQTLQPHNIRSFIRQRRPLSVARVDSSHKHCQIDSINVREGLPAR